jgi:hypothetical protein
MQADILINLAHTAELFHTPEGTGFADLDINGTRWTISANSWSLFIRMLQSLPSIRRDLHDKVSLPRHVCGITRMGIPCKARMCCAASVATLMTAPNVCGEAVLAMQQVAARSPPPPSQKSDEAVKLDRPAPAASKPAGPADKSRKRAGGQRGAHTTIPSPGESGASASPHNRNTTEASVASLLTPMAIAGVRSPERKLTFAQPGLNASTRVDVEGPGRELFPRAQWSRRATMESKFASEDAKLEISGTTVDIAREPNAGPSELNFLQSKNMERNQVDDLALKFSAFGALLTLRESSSSYAADISYLLELARRNGNKNALGRERFIQTPGDGHAGLQRLDLKLYEWDSLSVTAFGFRKDVDRSYESFVSAKAKDEFATADQTGEAGGVKLRSGAISVTSSYGSYKRMSGVANSTVAQQDHTVALDTWDLRSRLQGWGLAFPIEAFLPTSLYVTRFEHQTLFTKAADGPPDSTSGYSAGASWNWNSGYANVTYWDYRLDSQRVGDSSYDFAGRGLEIGFGAYGTAWGAYTGLSYYRADDLAPVSNSISSGYDAYALLTYKLDDFPDLSLNGSVSQYQYEGIAFPASSTGFYWSATLGLDFSKWLPAVGNASSNNQAAVSSGTAENPLGSAQPDIPGVARIRTSFNFKSPIGDKPSLKLFYRYAAETTEGGFGNRSGDSHLIAAILRGRL